MMREPKGALDVGRAVRAGEELDAERVTEWLRTVVPALQGLPEVTQFAGGASNWTYGLRYASHDLILRRPPSGTRAKSAHDMGREFKVQSALRPVFGAVPEMIALCTDPDVLGVDFYVMRRIEGIIPRKELGAQLDPGQVRLLCERFVDTLVALHSVDLDATGLRELGRGTGYARRQIEGWSDRFTKAHTWNVPRFSGVMRWLHDNTPDDVATCLIHGDFRLDNVVLDPHDPTQIIGVLDWEMATLGDPLMDLGNSLAYWVQADDDWFARKTRRQPTHTPGMLTRAEVVQRYCAATGRDAGHFGFYEVYGLFRLAVIIQQIYFRYHHGQTDNPAFRTFWALVHYLHWRCKQAIARA